MKIRYKKLLPAAKLPEYQTPGSAGADISVVVPGMGANIAPGGTEAFRTGLAVEVPDGYELQLRSRSSLALEGITVANAPATIDSDYRGEILVILHNSSRLTKQLFGGERVAQVVLCKVNRIDWIEEDLTPTVRNTKGIGSTGK